MEKQAVNGSEYISEPNPGLKAYFGRVKRGSDREIRTTFYKGRSLATILTQWDKTLNRISSQWPTLYEFENDLRKKVGPMSIMKPLSERMDDIVSYYDSILLESEPLDEAAIAAVIQRLSSIRGMLIRSGQKTLDAMKKSTNSGLPYFARKRSVISKTVPCTVTQEYSELPTGTWRNCAILGWRGQEGGPEDSDVKQRVVWMFPFSVNIEELRCYQPLTEQCQKFNLVPAWVGMESVDERITQLFDTKDPNDIVVCTDFSKFDQHFNRHMQDAAKSILTKILANSPDNAYWLENIFPIKYNIPLMIQWEDVCFGSHGMGSGSGGTNADETLTHMALQYEAALADGAELNPNSMCLGDDGLLTYPGITVESVVKSYSRHGQEMNLDKQYASRDDCTYLRRWHHKDYRIDGVCVGVYSTFRALGRLCEQEKYYDPDEWGPKMVALRQLSIIENCKYHPLREEFAEFCIKGDRYRLGIDIPGFLANIDSEAKKATDYMPDFLGYTKSQGKQTGINDWWIVNYLKSK